MGLITTLGNFCFIECDELNCSKKIEHVDINLLKEISALCGWKERGRRWRCPECNAKMLREGSEHHELWLKKKSAKMRE